jgi:N-acetylglucosaminyl-diphospho-decaprenol L-rhamnosyltransferase
VSAGTPARIRVVCVTYHPGPELEDFARSLATATAQPVDLVLVDNGTEHTVARAVAASYGARVVVTGENLGYGRAANLGAVGAASAWLVVANPDVVWEAGALDALLDAAQRHPRAGALGPRVLNPDGTAYPSARALPSLTNGVGHALLVRLWPSNPWTAAYLDHERHDPDTERTVGWLSGSCLLLRRAAFDEIGGFDDRYFMFFEDVDLGDRLARAGWHSVLVPDARVTHTQGTSWRERPEAMIRAHHASASRYLAGRYGRWYQWPVRALLRTGLAARRELQVRAARRTP